MKPTTEPPDFKKTFVLLVSRAQQSPEAQNELYEFLLPEVERLARQHIKFEKDLVDDVVQETLIAVMAVGVERMLHPKAYLATTVRRTAMRMSQKERPHDELQEDIVDENDGLENFENMELISRLGEVIDAMKTRCRRLLNMLSFKSEKDAHLAEELDMKESHVPAARYACLQSLKKKLSNQYQELFEGLKQL